MIRVIPSAKRHRQDLGWLDARWHFSFGDYHDPANVNFSTLRVFNDDVIAGGGGFDLHPHRDMEIITVMLDGTLRHRDLLGNDELLKPNEVQVMSAGRGITHGEWNASETDPAKLLQLWIYPRARGGEPRWDQRRFDPADRAGRLQPLVSGNGVPGTLTIDTDATIYRASLAVGQSVTHNAPGRRAYVFVIAGSVTLNDQSLAAGDQGRVEGETSLTLTASTDAEVLLLDLP